MNKDYEDYIKTIRNCEEKYIKTVQDYVNEYKDNNKESVKKLSEKYIKTIQNIAAEYSAKDNVLELDKRLKETMVDFDRWYKSIINNKNQF